ncbi:MAG: glycine cleavage system aminomethyltransferase GcvT [Anaerolineales bacterium]|nr:glycine cleavage system aminomethyltransferase GcvT [Anaerolineales bacterium]
MSDFLFRGTLEDIDPRVYELTKLEAERQYKKLILIPSESTSPIGVREALSTAFHNIYAEGYPPEETRWMTEDEVLDYKERISEYRRYSDPRYYKGVEYANIIEALARRRCAEAYASEKYTADDIFVNVQALSGGPANNAVYHALVQPGDTVMGMNLLFGGHLSHGSPVNRSGKYYNIVSYTINAETGRMDYEEIAELAHEAKPKMIIGGFSSYPWQVDWVAFRQIADEVGAYLIADISHVSGLVIAGAYPNPVDHAHVVTSTTHKTLNGPRGAVILTTDPVIARKIDRAVFPGEQGGPHVNVFAALAVAFKIAKTEEFKNLQIQTVKNCIALTNRLKERGLEIPFGGTDTHLTNLDCRTIKGPDGTSLSGDMAARLLDNVGIVVNRNTIPGDISALNPSGIRLGTPWVTQRGFKEKESIQLADCIADLLLATTPYKLKSITRKNQRTKVDFNVLEDVKMRVRDLALNAGIDFEPAEHGYPHSFYLDDKPRENGKGLAAYRIGGKNVISFLDYALSADVCSLEEGKSKKTTLNTTEGKIDCILTQDGKTFLLFTPMDKASLAAAWLRDLSDGFITIDENDLLKKIPGPVWVEPSPQSIVPDEKHIIDDDSNEDKPFYIGISSGRGKALSEFSSDSENGDDLRKTPLFDIHRSLGAKMVPFAGWEMPVWYSSVIEEHMAVRKAAGLFDVSHMGVFQAEGPQACAFLDSVCGYDISSLQVGESCYTHFLDPYANVIDDLLVYHRSDEKYLIVVNASNNDKDWSWLKAVRKGKVMVDVERPWAKAFGRGVKLRNLRDPKAGDAMKVDLALQGPRSLEILLALGCDWETEKCIRKLQRTQLCEAKLGAFDLVVSRTGYTGENMAFELFVHPDQLVALWNALLRVGEPMGLKPAGLGARDSLRTEAGLPLYGHEMGGEQELSVGDAGFRSYVKTYKPWFIGRTAFLQKESERKSIVVRFRFTETGVRMAHFGDPVVDKHGKVIGEVTSCAVDRFQHLTGQAYIDVKYADVDTPIYVYQNVESQPQINPISLMRGDKAALPTPATVLKRFPKL